MSFGTGVSEKDTLKGILGTADEVKGTAGQVKDFAGGQANRGEKAFKFFKESGKGAMDYWKNILGGDNAAMNEFLGPEVNRISESYSAPLKSLTEAGPRGGGTAGAVGTLQEGKARAMSDLFGKARPEAAKELGG